MLPSFEEIFRSAVDCCGVPQVNEESPVDDVPTGCVIVLNDVTTSQSQLHNLSDLETQDTVYQIRLMTWVLKLELNLLGLTAQCLHSPRNPGAARLGITSISSNKANETDTRVEF